jgi:processive 1,2-diacylglycerol beta-glucosyltransferase
MKNFLILSAPFGHGHNKSAENMLDALVSLGHTARIVDFFSAESRYVSQVAKVFFDKVVFEYPSMFGLACELSKRGPAQELTEYANRLSRRVMMKLLKKYQPDALIATHFTPLGAAAIVRREGNVPVYGIVTDYYAYPVWATEGADLYFTATGEVGAQLQDYGIMADKICCSGIPVGPGFTAGLARCDTRLTVTVMSGGFGLNLVEDVVRAINAVATPLQVYVLIGRNDKLGASIEALSRNSPHCFETVGFTDQVADFMKKSDLLITKPGGLTTAEAMAVGVPLIIYNPIPGPEEYNARFLTSRLAAVKATSEEDIIYLLSHFAADRYDLATMSACAARLGKPGAAGAIAETICADLARK